MSYFKKILLPTFLVLVLAVVAKSVIPLIAEPLIGKGLLLNPSGYSRIILAKNRQLLRLTLSSDDKYRVWTPLSEISPALQQATLIQEDRYFFWHPGVNPLALIKGVWSTYISGNTVGASTISMQLARLRFGINSRSISGKVKQISYALLLEALYSKQSILEAYLNLAPYGGNVEGAGAASLIYFGKTADKLNLPESLTLSVIPQDPNNRIPADRQRSLDEARDRLLARFKKVDPTAEILSNKDYPSLRKTDLPFKAPHLVERLVSNYPDLLTLHSTLDIGLQDRLSRIIDSYTERNRKIGISNAMALLLETSSMKVRAYIGSADYWSKEILGQNDGIKSRRSPGSALKPFLYGLALDQGLIHPGSLLKDTEFSRASYNPENYERDFVGPINATEALIRSRNIPAVMLLNQLKPSAFYRFLQQSGIKDLKSESHYGLSMILGGVEVRMDELATLYAMLGREGRLGQLTILENETARIANKEAALLSPEASDLTLKMLSENPRPLSGFDSTQTVSKLSVPWKTGTSFGFRDAWAAGIVGPYTLVVWIGNFDSSGNPSFIGRDAAGPLFFSIADAITSDQPIKESLSKSTLNIKKVQVCSVSGELPGPFCGNKKTSWFIPGKSPIHSCNLHREVAINPANNLRLCPGSTDQGLIKIMEFWPSDLMELFNRAGVPRTIPPDFEKDCQKDISNGNAPTITSPQENIIYQIEYARTSIPLSAVTDADSRRTYWFADDALLGESAPAETFFWHASPGQYLIRAVDSQGRSNQIEVSIQSAAGSLR